METTDVISTSIRALFNVTDWNTRLVVLVRVL